MLKYFSYFSIKQKLLFAFGGAIVMLIFISLMAISAFQTTENDISTMVNEVQPVVESAKKLSAELKNAVGSMGFYLLTKEKYHKTAYEDYLQAIDQGYLKLSNFSLVNNNPAYVKMINEINIDLNKFKNYKSEIVALTEEPMKNIPALRMANQSINPKSIEMLGLISQMINSEEEEEQSEERKGLNKLFNDMRYSSVLTISGLRAYIAFKGESNRANTLLYIEQVEQVLEKLKEYEELLTFEQAEAYEQLTPVVNDYKSMLADLFEIHGSEKAYQNHYLVRTEIGPLVSQIDKKLLTLSQQLNNKISDTGKQLLEDTANNRNFILIFTTIGVLGGALSALIIFISINKPLCRIVSALNDIAEGEGDLTHLLDVDELSKDEVSKLSRGFNTFVTKIHMALVKVNSSVESLVQENSRISHLMQESNNRDKRQRNETDKVAESMSDMLEISLEMDKKTESASKSTQEADSSAKEGQRILNQTIHSIKKLENNVETATNVINLLGSDVDNISSVAEVIKGIAEQTNLLALNAAIEAARAGEQGRGFAVVADEVRMLASKTQESTQEIQGTIEKLQSASQEAIGVMKNSKEQTIETVSIAGQASQTLNVIVNAVESINEMNQYIASASIKQSNINENIKSNMDNIVDISLSAEQASQEVNDALGVLNNVSEQLKTLISVFKI